MLPRVVSRVYALGLILLVFGAMHIPSAGGYLTAAPGIPLILLASIFGLFSPWPYKVRSELLFRDLRLARNARKVWLIGAGLSGFSFFIFGFSSLYLAKSFSLAVLTLIWLSPFILAHFFRLRHIKWAALAGFLVCLCAFLFSDFLNVIPEILRGFLFSEEYKEMADPRPRGFMEEPSHFSAIVSCFAWIIFLINEKNQKYSVKRLIFFALGLSLILLIMGSKGAIGSVAIALFAISGFDWRKLPYLVLILPLVWILGSSQVEALVVDFEEFTSISTRLGLVVTAVLSVVTNPFGYGYYGFYGAVQHYGVSAMDFLSNNLPLNFSEMKTIVEDLVAVSTKSATFDFLMMYGVFYLWLMRSVLLSMNLRDPRVRVAGVYFFLLSFSNSGHISVLLSMGWLTLYKVFPSIKKESASERKIKRLHPDVAEA